MNNEDSLYYFLETTLKRLSTSYSYSVHKEGANCFRTIWSKPTAMQPIPNPVANVFFRMDDKQNKYFQLENQRFAYQNSHDLDFERALDSIIRSKKLAKLAGINLSASGKTQELKTLN